MTAPRAAGILRARIVRGALAVTIGPLARSNERRAVLMTRSILNPDMNLRQAFVRLCRLPLIAVLLFAHPALAQDERPLPPQDAYRYVVNDTGNALEIDWAIEDGYYLYRNKLAFETETPGITLGTVDLPDGLRHEDEFFGVQQIYRDRFFVTVPYEVDGERPPELELITRLQGCADIGICYPPQRWPTTVALAGSNAPTLAATAAAPSFGSFSGGSNEFLPVDDAFRPMLLAIDGNTVEVSFQIAPGYYLYKDKITATARSGQVQLGSLRLPDGRRKTDEYFGDMEVYYDEVFATLPLARATPDAMPLSLEIGFQGCADGGICYPPVTRTLDVELPRATAVADASGFAAGRNAPVSEQARLAQLIGDASMLAVIATFFGAGLLLAFTPCVLPMIPILSGIIAGDGDDVSPMRGFSLALSYVMGMAIIYTAAGIAAAAIGVQMQAVFNAPWVLILFSGLFVALALSMFGLYDLQMPSAIQSRIATVSGQQKSGTMIGAFVMGALSSLIVTACVAPPLVATLTVIGQAGDVVRGGMALFALSLGMGAPLLAVGASAGRLLPKAGPWTVAVKQAFGFMMLGLAIWMLSRILPDGIVLAMWGVLVFMAGVWLGGLTTLSDEASGPRKLAKGTGLLAVIYGAALLVGALAGGHNPLQPLAGLNTVAGGSTDAHRGLDFMRVKTVDDLDRALAAASAQNRPAMLDFYADWCVSCIEMEEYTFTDPLVQAALADAVLLQADVTANDGDDQALLQRFGIYGPPTIVFFGRDGRQLDGYEIVGYMKAAEFAEHVERALDSRDKLIANTSDPAELK